MGLFEVFKLSISRQEVIEGVLGVDPNFYRIAFLIDLLLSFGQRESTRNHQLPLHEVIASNHLGDGMLNLKPGVHLHEKMLIRIQVEDELHCPGVVVSDSFGSIDSRTADILADEVWYIGRSFFYNLLMSSLDWAISFKQMDVVSMGIAEDLNFDVPRPRDVLFNKHSIIFEGLQWLSLAGLESFGKVFFLCDNSHAFSSSAWDCFDQDGVAHFLGLVG